MHPSDAYKNEAFQAFISGQKYLGFLASNTSNGSYVKHRELLTLR